MAKKKSFSKNFVKKLKLTIDIIKHPAKHLDVIGWGTVTLGLIIGAIAVGKI